LGDEWVMRSPSITLKIKLIASAKCPPKAEGVAIFGDGFPKDHVQNKTWNF